MPQVIYGETDLWSDLEEQTIPHREISADAPEYACEASV